MKEFNYLYNPHSSDTLQRGAEMVSAEHIRHAVYMAISRMHDQDVLQVFRCAFLGDFLIRGQLSACRFDVVPTNMFADLIDLDQMYPVPLPGKRVWTKEELAQVIAQFSETRVSLARVYNLLHASSFRNPGESGHHFAVPFDDDDEKYIILNMPADHTEAMHFPNPAWPKEEEIEEVMHRLSVGGWRMPKGWTLKRTGVAVKGR